MRATPPNMKLGNDLWRALSPQFHQVAADHSLIERHDRAQLWMGFMTAATGEMALSIGVDTTQLVLRVIGTSCADSAAAFRSEEAAAEDKPNLTLVKP